MNDFELKVEENVKWLASIGADPTGGTTRLLYDENWRDAQKGLKQKFESIGMETNFDAVGNLFGRIEGSKYPHETIMSGSHVDTVVNGGPLDGQFGIVGAYLAMEMLQEKYGQPLRSLEVVSMAEEEGSRFPYAFWGSKNIWGIANKEDVMHSEDANGVKFVDAMKESGFAFRDENGPLRKDIKAFVELHIEQGNVLENTGKQVGVVNNIVGQKRYTVTLKGEANHAGTTPMGYRHDTVYAYSKIVTHGIEKAEKKGDPLVLTFGHVEVQPNTVNVVPGFTSFSIDCRHTEASALHSFTKELEEDMKVIAKEMGMEIEIDCWMDEAPTPMSKEIVEVLEDACADLNFQVMHSGAGQIKN